MSETIKHLLEAINDGKLSLDNGIFACEKFEIGKFYHTKFMKLGVIVWSSENGVYINIPKLFESLQCYRKIATWKKLEDSKRYLDGVSYLTKIHADHFFVTKLDVMNELKGDYAHEKIIYEILRWASIDHAILMDQILTNLHVHGLQNEHKLKIREKDDKIDLLMRRLDEMELKSNEREKEAQNRELVRQQDQAQLMVANNNLMTQIIDMRAEMNDMRNLMRQIVARYETTTVTRINQLQEYVCCVTYTDDNNRIIIEFIRTQHRNINPALKKIRNVHPDVSTESETPRDLRSKSTPL